MHFVDDLVLRISQVRQVGVDAGPGPGAAVRVALDEYVLRRSACCSDAVNRGLVHVED